MATRNLIRWSGLALVLAGFAFTLATPFHPNNYDTDSALNRFWSPVQLGLGLSYLLSVLGLVGWHLRQAEKVGILGLVGFILALFGSALTVTTSLLFAYLLPAVATQQATPTSVINLLNPSGSLAWVSLVSLTFLLFFVPGFIISGIVTIRAGVLPRWAGWLVTLGLIVLVIGNFIPPLFVIVHGIGGVAFGIGLIWLGYALWSEKSATTVQA
jgi:hypothetical protein